MPGRKWYVVAGIVFVASLTAFAVFLFDRIGEIGESFERFVVPGGAEIEAVEPGRYTIFHESTSTVGGMLYRVGDVSGLVIEVVSPEGSRLEVRSPVGSTTYEFGGREGAAIAAFEVERPGTYRISADYADGAGPETVLAVSRGFGARLFTTVFGAIGLSLGGTLLAVGIAVATFVMRYRARRRGRSGTGAGDRPPAVARPGS